MTRLLQGSGGCLFRALEDMVSRAHRLMVPLLFAFTFSISFSQPVIGRDAVVDKLIEVQAKKVAAILDDRALEALIGRFRRTNPKVTEDIWFLVKKDVGEIFVRILIDKQGPFSSTVKQAMQQFTTGEIERLIAIHTDPLFIKYNDATIAAMKTPAGELAFRMAIEQIVVEMNELVVKRGLEPVY